MSLNQADDNFINVYFSYYYDNYRSSKELRISLDRKHLQEDIDLNKNIDNINTKIDLMIERLNDIQKMISMQNNDVFYQSKSYNVIIGDEIKIHKEDKAFIVNDISTEYFEPHYPYNHKIVYMPTLVFVFHGNFYGKPEQEIKVKYGDDIFIKKR